MQTKLERLKKAGQRRFVDKVSNFQFIADDRGWEQALYEGIMTAMGYSKNKWQFAELAKKLPILQLKKLDNLLSIQAALFGVAGLLPSQTQRQISEDEHTKLYVKEIEAIWKNIHRNFDMAMSSHQWIFSAQRPANFPTVRIGQAGVLINRLYKYGIFEEFYKIFGNLINETNAIKELYKQLSLFFVADINDFWATHYTFWGKPHKASKNLIGKRRLKAIVLNILLPIFYAHSQSTGNKKLREFIWALYNQHSPLGENRITKYQSKILQIDNKLIKTACLEQGMIYVYQDTCFQKLCGACSLGVI